MNPQDSFNGQNVSNPQVIMPDQGANFDAYQTPMTNQVVQQANTANLGATAMTANQTSPISPNKEAPTSTQATLLISEIRDNVVIMKDGSFRAVVACKSINFDLMSNVEQEGIEYS